MLARLPLFFIALLFFSASTWGAEKGCKLRSFLQGMFEIKPVEGQLIAKAEVSHLLPNLGFEYEVRHLGGGAGGEVVRIIPKDYPERAFTFKLTDLDASVNDQAAFELIRSVVGKESEVKVVSTRIIPNTEDYQHMMNIPSVMKIQNVKGRTLFSLLADPEVPEAVKVVLRQKYTVFLHQLSRDLNVRYGLKGVTFDANALVFKNVKSQAAIQAQPSVAAWSMKISDLASPQGNPKLFKKLSHVLKKNGRQFGMNNTVDLILKSDNIVVTRKYEFFLIDPY